MLAYVRAMYGETGHSAAPTSVKGKEPVPPLIQDVDDEDMDEDDDDRLFAFEVSKTNEQEEGITSRPGFTVRDSRCSPPL